MSPESSSMDLESLPGVGRKMAADLRSIGIFSPADLKGRDPEQLFHAFEARAGRPVDRCVLYVYRCAVDYVSRERHDPEKLKWWNWTDRRMAE